MPSRKLFIPTIDLITDANYPRQRIFFHQSKEGLK
ncbi:hypothetical protein PSPTO_3962 [Pseudomonas syringae pv. tomato str. DC3000]|uniref:Uncharacterized protein n=1 Tax=Pseudomonas syringae pv. tomato (strain ATCC BAA-871 / DC3000) TaxID=223283 RepID=Q87Y47_PSESM|nr:hypothetical protein PSPTO_3962 [Pseudomonas syringae pv. tomato str. DC3000]